MPNKNLLHPLFTQPSNKKIANGKPNKNSNVAHLSQFYEFPTDFFFTQTAHFAIVNTQDKLDRTFNS